MLPLQTIDKPSEGNGEVCNLPIFNQIWRTVPHIKSMI